MRKEDDEMNQFGFNQSMLSFYIATSKLNCFYFVHYYQDTI